MDLETLMSEFGMSESDLIEIVELFSAHRMEPLPPGVPAEDLPVCTKELGALLEAMGFLFTEAELLNFIHELDPEHMGYIELSNFLKNGAKPLFEKSRYDEETAKEVFKLMDLDGDKMVDLQDLKRTMKIFGEELPINYLKEMLKEVDIDGDHFISYDEFLFFTTGIVA